MAKQPPIRMQWSSDLDKHTGVVPAWTNGMDLWSQLEWPYLLHGHLNLKYLFNRFISCWTSQLYHSYIQKHVFYRVDQAMMWDPLDQLFHLKLEALSWLWSLWLQMFARSETYPLKSKISECTDPILCLASSQAGELVSYMLMAHSGSDLKQGCKILKHISVWSIMFWHLALNNSNNFPLTRFPVSLLCCDHILLFNLIFFFFYIFLHKPLPIHFNWEPLADETLYLYPTSQVEHSN